MATRKTPKVKRKHAATGPNAKRGLAGLRKVAVNGTRDTVAGKAKSQNRATDWSLTSPVTETKATPNVKRKIKAGVLMVSIEEPVKLTARTIPKWSAFSTTLGEFLVYVGQGVDFSKHICRLYRQYDA
jgi:hypothetical protein